MKYKRYTKPIEEELEVPNYPKRLEKKIAQQQRIKRLFSFYSNLSKEKRINIFLVLIAVVVFVGLLSSEPTMTGFHSFGSAVINCDSCVGNEAKANSLVEFSVDRNIKVIYPASWDIVNINGGYVSVYDEENYQIEQSQNGKFILKSPEKAGSYSFKAVADGFIVEDKIIRIK